MFHCEQSTKIELDYEVLVSTNLTLCPDCGGNPEEDTIVNYFFGNPAQSHNADPCGQLSQMLGVRNDIYSFTFPDGTRFRPLRFDKNGDADACWIEINCR